MTDRQVRVGPEPQVDRSGMAALGHPVPEHRLTAACRLLKGWGFGTEDAMALVGRIAHYIEVDEPFKAQKCATGGAPLDRPESSATQRFDYPDELPARKLDLTGGLRLYCVLLAEGRT